MDDPELKSKLERLLDEMFALFFQVDYLGTPLQTHASLTGTRGVLRMYFYNKDPNLLAFAEKLFADYKQYGMTANYENYNWFNKPSWTEPCGIVDSYMLAIQLWEATGKPQYLTDAHEIWYNALLRTQRENGGFGCDTCVEDCKVGVSEFFYEAYHCCSMRGAEGLGYIARKAVYEFEDNVLFPVFCDYTVRLSGGEVIRQRAAYPIDGHIKITVCEGVGRTLNAGFYLPPWATGIRLMKNGQVIPYTVDNGFVYITEQFETGDTFEFIFNIPLRIAPVQIELYKGKGLYLLEHGTLVLGAQNDVAEPIVPEKLTYLQNGVYSGYGTEFVPIQDAYHLSKEENQAKKYQILFKIVD